MNAPSRLRAAVIGAGFVGPHHVDALRRGGYAEVAVIADVDAARAQDAASALRVPAWTNHVDEVFADPAIDVVHVCTPNATHAELTSAALHAGKHVVVEKPLAPSYTEGRDLAALARERGRHGLVSFTYRGYPMVRRARSLVASGDVGDIRLAHGAYLQDWLSEPDDYNWRLERSEGGASRAVADIGTHWFDTVEFMTGLRVASVNADLATLIPERWRPAAAGNAFESGTGKKTLVGIETEDAATILLRFEGEARGVLLVSQVSPGHRNDLSIDLGGSKLSVAWRQEHPEQLWLGSRGDVRILDRAPSDQAWGVPDLPAGHPEGWAEALRDLFRPFYEAIAQGTDPGQVAPGAYPTLNDGARAVAFVEAVLRSSRSGQWESLAQ